MANDGGMIAVIEQWLVDTLAALTSGGENVFKTAEAWRHQISGTKGGLEAFSRYAPFAFISYQDCSGAREGEHDLRQVLAFAILIGVESKTTGDARTGNAQKLGTSRIRDLVIAALDHQRPAGEFAFAIDDFLYISDVEVIDTEKQHAIQIIVECSYMTV